MAMGTYLGDDVVVDGVEIRKNETRRALLEAGARRLVVELTPEGESRLLSEPVEVFPLERDEPDAHTVFGASGPVETTSRTKLRELLEFQAKWLVEIRELGGEEDPLAREAIAYVEGMDRVVSETEAAIAAYGYGEIRCGNVCVDVDADGSKDRIADLKQWWLAKAEGDVEMVAEKAVTYGSNSLQQLGMKMAQLRGSRTVSEEEAQELGCWVYLTGKAERWTDAVMRGERPKDDTILDIAMYATMALRIRNAGGWPDSEG